MKLRAHTILMITSFVPVVLFKVIAKTGGATLERAKLATAIGLVLALGQVTLSRSLLKQTTYLERAFVAFLLCGAVWVYVLPPQTALLFAVHSTTLLYVVLFLTTLVPQIAGYDPFTYAIAKQWYPETVWKTPQFRTINLHITYAWSAVFFVAALSSFLGQGRPFFSIVVPLVFVLGLGLPFSMKYPDYFLKRAFSQTPVDPSAFPSTAKELVARMPLGFDPHAVPDLKAEIQFELSGDGGGEMVLSVVQGRCTYHEGKGASPTLTIRSSGETWLKVARGEIDRPKALMDGLYSVEGDMGLLMQLGRIFPPPSKPSGGPIEAEEPNRTKGEKKMVKILAIQGSPRPKVSNTGVLLGEFLKGAESEGALTETINLKEKEIHSCIGCYACWTKTPGVCVFKDDMPALLEKVKDCQVMVYATPLYNFNMTALTKAFQERLLPLLDPHLVKEGNTYRHPFRYDTAHNFAVISTCGFPEVSHFDGLRAVFHHLEISAGAKLVGELLVPAAEMALKQVAMRERAKPILEAAFKAGVELVREGRVSRKTEEEIQKPLFTADEVASMANTWFDGFLQGVTRGRPQDPQNAQDIRLVLKGMALVFNPEAAPGLKAAIQFDVTGKQPGKWFLSIDQGVCTFNEGTTASPTLTIRTPSEVWLAVSNKELDGQQAFMERRYTVEGDMGLLMRMKSLFS